MTTTDNIHRYLDEAFADVPRTPENADLKEEIRGNLAARVAELEASGSTPASAAATAISELGDIHRLLESMDDGEGATEAGGRAARIAALNRVKLDPRYVVRTVFFALILAVMVAGIIFTAAFGPGHPATLPTGSVWYAVGLGALLVAMIVVDGLRRETSQHYPMPLRRALAYGGAALLGLGGLDIIALFLGGHAPRELLTVAIVATLFSLVSFIWLGVTQTNRLKPWVREMNSAYAVDDRFSKDPAAAARFGLYTVVIWIAGIGAFVALSITVGFAWSWLALVGALIVFFLVLARMLFPADKGTITR